MAYIIFYRYIVVIVGSECNTRHFYIINKVQLIY